MQEFLDTLNFNTLRDWMTHDVIPTVMGFLNDLGVIDIVAPLIGFVAVGYVVWAWINEAG